MVRENPKKLKIRELEAALEAKKRELTRARKDYKRVQEETERRLADQQRVQGELEVERQRARHQEELHVLERANAAGLDGAALLEQYRALLTKYTEERDSKGYPWVRS